MHSRQAASVLEITIIGLGKTSLTQQRKPVSLSCYLRKKRTVSQFNHTMKGN